MGIEDREDPAPQRRIVDLSVIQYQVGAMQTALDRGIGGLEKSIDKGFEAVGVRLDRFETRLKTIEERQAFDAARLKALEQFRDEQDRREADRAKEQARELAVAVDGSASMKTLRLITSLVVGVVGFIGTLVAIIIALTGGFG